jgi:two-component system sensor histidine kinase KdpD
VPERPRPDPDALLALIRATGESAAAPRGRFKLFFGATAGVGKTYAMLQAAQERRREGTDVVVGIAETHGRRETEALLAGLDVLPRKRTAHRGVVLEEFDIDAALARRPQIILVDELAHTNAPGSRHERRWQDVEELLAAGIDVYSTLNVQHIESLNDVVASVTGVTVRETVPDPVIESADEIELIDLPPDELLQRLREGKVYASEQAARATEGFFQKGNLIALRQLALLRTASRVDRQMEVYRRAHAATETWAVRDRLLVAIGRSGESLVRQAKRIADRVGAEWIAVLVETPAFERWSQQDRDRAWEVLRLAEELGARTVSLSGVDAATELLSYARTHNVTSILIGKPSAPGWRDMLGLSFQDRIVRQSGQIDVQVLSGERGQPRVRTVESRAERGAGWRGYLWGAGAVTIATALAALWRPFFERTNLAMIYLLAVALVAVRWGRSAAVLTSVLGVAAFDFFFVPPYLTFAVADTEYLLTFAVMLVVGVVIGTLTARLRDQGDAARRREWRTAFLYDVSRDLLQMADVPSLLTLVVPRISSAFDAAVDVFLPDDAGGLVPWGAPGDVKRVEPGDVGVLQWVHVNRRPAGLGTDTFGTRPALFLPVAADERSFGVLRIQPSDVETLRAPSQVHLIETVANQLAATMERLRLSEESRRIRQLEEMDRLKTEFVEVASRELRAPLRTLSHRVSQLGDAGTRDPDLRAAIDDDIERLGALVDDLLDLSLIESGRLELAKAAVSPADAIDAAISTLAGRATAQGVELASDLTDALPSVAGDMDRLVEVLESLIDNALRYAPRGGHVMVSADDAGRYVQFSVADDGPGIPVEDQSRVFDKFARLQGPGEDRSTRLGLAIAREIVRAHRGAIWVDSGPGPGSVFSFTIPHASGLRPSASDDEHVS